MKIACASISYIVINILFRIEQPWICGRFCTARKQDNGRIAGKIAKYLSKDEAGVRQISLSGIFSSKLFDSVPLITFVNYSELRHLL